MKGDAKSTKWGSLGYLGFTQGQWKSHYSTEFVLA